MLVHLICRKMGKPFSREETIFARDESEKKCEWDAGEARTGDLRSIKLNSCLSSFHGEVVTADYFRSSGAVRAFQYNQIVAAGENCGGHQDIHNCGAFIAAWM